MHRFPLILVAGSLLFASAAAGESIPADSLRARDARRASFSETDLFPVEADGDIRFQADGTVFRDDDGAYVLEATLQVPHIALAWIRSGPVYRAELSIDVEARSADGELSRAATVKRAVSADSFESTRRQDASAVLVVSLPTSFEPTSAFLRVTDLRAKKKTLIGLFQGSNKSGEVEGLLPSHGTVATIQVSAPLLALSVDKDAGSEEPALEAVRRAGWSIVPNATHFVGHGRTVFPVYLELFDPDFAEGTVRRVPLRYRITTEGGDPVLSAPDTVDMGAPRWGRVQRFSCAEFPTGTYALAVELLSETSAAQASAYTEFHVVWNPRTFAQDEQTVLDDARVLLDAETFLDFEQKAPGERAAYMASLWSRIDPTPGTPENEREAEFRRRVQRAVDRFGGVEGGKLSDRGRVLIRFGAPDETVLTRVPGQPDALAARISTEIVNALGTTIDVSSQRFQLFLDRYAARQSRPTEVIPFEIWKYYGGGDPILPEMEGSRGGMAFIFVDPSGVGLYRLGYTNVSGIQ